jgi:hypothetical protein
MRKLYGFTLTAMFTLVAMAPNTAAAIPVPPEDVVPPECTDGLSSVCADEITVPGLVVGPGGIAPGEITCDLVAEIPVTVEMTITIGHIIITVTFGMTICDYGICGLTVQGGVA